MAADGKHSFVTLIQQAYGRRLRSFLSARLRNAAADTPDLMQEVYLRLLRVDDQEAIRNPQAYLFTVASHVLQQHTLKQSRALNFVGLEELEAQLRSGVHSDPAVQTETDQAFEELGRSLQKLSPRAYATLILSRCDGMALKDIAAQLGVSRDQVKKYLARALLHVRTRLDEMSREIP